MKNKRVMFAVLFIFLVFLSVSLVSADLNDTKINNAYICLQNKTSDCSTSLDDNIFTLLTLGTCQSKVMNASSGGECWPASSCKVKQTAQAIFALKASGGDTTKPVAWLFTHNRTASSLQWFLQIESNEATECTITYSGSDYSVSIDANRKVLSDAGDCLSVSSNGDWLQVDPSFKCQSYEYKISCDKSFITTTLFKDSSSDTIHVSDKINTGSAGGSTTEKINSLCFGDSSSCNYEGTLWGALALKSLDYDITPYIPYIITMADSNPDYLPEAFIYIFLGSSYEKDLLNKQQSGKYWDASQDKFYDTALALYALQYSTASQKTGTIDWLMGNQDKQGCWQGSIRDTAFLLYAISPRGAGSGGGGGSQPNCEANGNYCVSSIDCNNARGSEINGYQCAAGFVCCNKQPATQTCSTQGGIICSSSEKCSGGDLIDASDAGFGSCCVNGGTCVPSNNGPAASACETSGGNCRTTSCESGETPNSGLSCEFSSQVCCFTTTPQTSSSSSLWIWILSILIVLVALGIIFRNKLREFWFRLSSGSHSRPRPSPSDGSLSLFPERRMIPRRIIPHVEPSSRPPQLRKRGELDEVLKKLKDMSK